MNMRKVRIFLRAMREGMDVTSIFGGDAPRLPLGTTRFGHSRIGSQADDIEESRRRAAKERDAAYQAAVRIDRMKWEDKVASDRRDRKSVAHVDRARTSPRPALRDSLRPYFEATVRGMRW